MSLEPNKFETALDKALSIPADRVVVRAERMRAQHPHATTEELVELAGRALVRDVSLSSGAVGTAAALPSVGTITAAGLTTAQTAAFFVQAAYYVLTVAQLQGISVVDLERRRTLLLSALLGKEGQEIIEGQLGMQSLVWVGQLVNTLPISTVRTVNAKLATRAAKYAGRKVLGVAAGRLAPLGIGAAVGWWGGRSLARQVIESTQVAMQDHAADLVSSPKVVDLDLDESKVIDL